MLKQVIPKKTTQKTTNVVPTSVDIMDSKLPAKDNVSNIEKQTNIVDLTTTKESSFSQSSFLEGNKQVTNDDLFKVPRKSKDKNQSFSSRSKPNFSQQSDTQYNYDPSYLYRKDKNRLDQRSGRQSNHGISHYSRRNNSNYDQRYANQYDHGTSHYSRWNNNFRYPSRKNTFYDESWNDSSLDKYKPPPQPFKQKPRSESFERYLERQEKDRIDNAATTMNVDKIQNVSVLKKVDSCTKDKSVTTMNVEDVEMTEVQNVPISNKDDSCSQDDSVATSNKKQTKKDSDLNKNEMSIQNTSASKL